MKDFDEFAGNILDVLFGRMEAKHDEYATTDNKLEGIQVISNLTDVTPETIFKVLIAKHCDALLNKSKHIDYETLLEKGIDIMSYLILWMYYQHDVQWGITDENETPDNGYFE